MGLMGQHFTKLADSMDEKGAGMTAATTATRSVCILLTTCMCALRRIKDDQAFSEQTCRHHSYYSSHQSFTGDGARRHSCRCAASASTTAAASVTGDRAEMDEHTRSGGTSTERKALSTMRCSKGDFANDDVCSCISTGRFERP